MVNHVTTGIYFLIIAVICRLFYQISNYLSRDIFNKYSILANLYYKILKYLMRDVFNLFQF